MDQNWITLNTISRHGTRAMPPRSCRCLPATAPIVIPASGGLLSDEAIAEYAIALWTAFPDLRFEFVSAGQVAENLVAAQWVMHGTQQGAWRELPPTGKRVELPGADFIVVTHDGIQSVSGYFDTRLFAEQLGLAVTAQPRSLGPFSFGTAIAARSGKATRPGAFSITSLHPRSEAEAKQVVEASHRIAAGMLAMPGFISMAAMNVGGMLMTVTAWERPQDVRQISRNDIHQRAAAGVRNPGLSAGLMSSVWVPEHINSLVRCEMCNLMQSGDQPASHCRCGALLPEPLPFW